MIKFRVYDNRAKQILERPIIVFQDNVISVSSNENSVIDDYVLMQSTGLTDKNGKEIYEGDIFKAPFDIGPAGFSMSKGVVEYDLEQGYQWEYLLLSEMEIIGNIYENPEILK